MRLRAKIAIVTAFAYVLAYPSFSQNREDSNYNSEFIWGINKNSSGGLIGGFVFKKSKRLNDYMLETYGLEIMNVKHAQEQRSSSRRTGNFFIYGKSNYLYALRFQYGRDIVLFRKAPQQGVEIKGVVAAGPSLGIVAPYYVELATDNSIFETSREQYDPSNPDHAFTNILGTGGLFEGIGHSNLQLGGNIKAGLNFELGTIKNQATGFEVGFLLDSYVKRIILMPTSYNRAVYPTIYFTLFYGTRK